MVAAGARRPRPLTSGDAPETLACDAPPLPPPASRMSPPPRRLPLWLVALIVTAIVRSLVAWSRLDELELERYGTTIASCLLGGMPLHPAELPIIAHLRGSYLFGLALVPLVWLFGPGLVTVKALAVGWSALTAAALTALVERTLGRAAGLAALAFFAFAWPAYQMVDVLALGSHADTVLFLALPLLWLARRSRPTGLTAMEVAVFGALVGAGCLFSMQLWVALPATAAVYLLSPQGPRAGWIRRQLAGIVAALPFLALIPLLTRSATVVNKPISQRILPEGVGGAIERATGLVGNDLRRSWLFEEHGGEWLSWLLAACLLAGLVLLSLRLRPGTWFARGVLVPWRDRMWIYAALHVAAFTGAYAISDFRLNFDNWADGMGSRYLMPLFLALCIWQAGGVEWAVERGARAVGWLLAAVPAICGLVGLAHLVRLDVGTALPPVQGAELYSFREHVEYAGGEDMAARLEWIERLEPDWAEDRHVAYAQVFLPRKRSNPQLLRGDMAQVGTLPEHVRPYVLTALGAQSVELFVDTIDWSKPQATGLLADLMQRETARLPREQQRWFLMGQGRGLTWRQLQLTLQRFYYTARSDRVNDPVAVGFDVVRKHDPPAQAYLLWGMGFYFGLRVTPYERIHVPLLEHGSLLEPELLTPWMTGFVHGFRFRFQEPGWREPGPLQFERHLGEREQAEFRRLLAERS